MKYFKFEKEPDNKWYVVLPEWKGDKSDLEMVLGADTMLDIVAQGETAVEMTISEKPFESQKIELHFDREEGEGGWYKLKSDMHQFDVWLCYVLKFVYGGLPKILYCK